MNAVNQPGFFLILHNTNTIPHAISHGLLLMDCFSWTASHGLRLLSDEGKAESTHDNTQIKENMNFYSMGYLSHRVRVKPIDSVKPRGSEKNLHCWDVFTRERICGITDEQAGFPYSPARKVDKLSVSEHTHTPDYSYLA